MLAETEQRCPFSFIKPVADPPEKQHRACMLNQLGYSMQAACCLPESHHVLVS